MPQISQFPVTTTVPSRTSPLAVQAEPVRSQRRYNATSHDSFDTEHFDSSAECSSTWLASPSWLISHKRTVVRTI
ncbi:hypothetical protein TELCIR_06159 [Teladorsagia circumcincta]|uniref:Uncharacterized protein n=1 Tax=Teladorsagia circumcincta TaxID=45464 RepID=A0A2G9UNV3_TELCI|nr:hypothetical protein TELCIR_06159 [Teladorsagia circumcincta]